MNRFLRQLLPALCVAASCTLATPAISRAQYNQADIGSLNKPLEPYAYGEVGVDETKLGNSVPPELAFRNEDGAVVHLSDYLHQGRPVVLWMGYYQCPMLCDQMSAGMVQAFKQVKLDAGNEFTIVSVSINPNESSTLAKAKKATYLKELGQPQNAAAWNLLTGSPESIKALADSVGYKFKKVTIEGEAQYAHPAVLMILSPEGKLTRYLYPTASEGVQFDPRTVQLSLIEASHNTVGTVVDRIVLTCLHYDAVTGKYTKDAQAIMKIAGGLTVLIMAAIFLPLWYKAMRSRRPDDDAATPSTGEVLT